VEGEAVNRPEKVKACRCPGCGRVNGYDPAKVVRYARAEGQGDQRRWRGYDVFACASCGLPVFVPDGGEPEGLSGAGGNSRRE
jgi:hypothetical protein